MQNYQNILVALELEPESDKKLIQKANEIREQYNATLTLLHAVEHISNYGAAYGISVGVDVEEELEKEAEKTLEKVAHTMQVPKERQIVKIGPAKQLIIEQAETGNTDLILIGSHGRHGVRLLLGSTANAVLHSAKCDVLAVRVPD